MSDTKTWIDPATLATAANYATIIGGAATVIGFFMERDENRRMLSKLDEIKKYIKKIDADIQVIKQQNQAILNKIDLLPVKIQAIVDEIIDEALIEERYSSLDRITKNYFLLPGGEDRYLINTEGWDELSDLLNYIFRNDNRISTFFELIKYCEFAIMVSDFQGTPLIANMIENKLIHINELHAEIQLNCNEKAQDLLASLNNTNYIAQHNFNANLSNFQDFNWQAKPKKKETETYKVKVKTGRECDGGERGGFCRNTYGYENRTRPAQHAIQYNQRRQQFINTIPQKMEALINQLKNFKEVEDLIAMLKFYLEAIETDFNTNKFSEELILPMGNQKDSNNADNFILVKKDVNPYLVNTNQTK